jgi:hypothetical protein
LNSRNANCYRGYSFTEGNSGQAGRVTSWTAANCRRFGLPPPDAVFFERTQIKRGRDGLQPTNALTG